MLVMGDLGSPAEEGEDAERSPYSRMDSPVWGRMPEPLVEEVLRRLPIAAQLRFRSVCRRWKDTLSCPNFLWDCAPSGPVPATILSFESQFSLVEWEEPLFPFPASVNSYRLKPLRPLRLLQPCASDAGLVCLRSKCFADLKVSTLKLYVLNPMTRAWRMLPNPGVRTSLPVSVALVADAPSKAYKVVLAAPDPPASERWALRVYDSCSDSWHLASATLPELRCRRPALRDGVLHYLDRNGTFAAFRLHDEVAWKVAAPRPEALLDCACLVTHCGEVLLVGVLAGSFTSFKVWRLGPGGRSWEPLTELCEASFESLFPHCGARDESWGALALGDSLCIELWLYDFVRTAQSESHAEPELQVEPNGRRVLLAYDLVMNVWHVLPVRFDGRPECKASTVLLPFEPRLDLIV